MPVSVTAGMCQKQFGNFFGSFAGSHTDHFRVTRGTLAVFRSSDDASADLPRLRNAVTYRALSRPRISVSIGSVEGMKISRLRQSEVVTIS